MESAFIELSLIVAVATLVAAVAKLLRQPLIIAYIVAGILASPHLLGLIESTDLVGGFAQIGVALLLFIVGLQLNPKALKNLGGATIFLGLGQVIITAGLGYFVALGLGFGGLTAWYIAAALTFSSTIIVMKIISDRGEVNSLYGRLSVGLLLIQDLIVVILFLFISSGFDNLVIGELVISLVLKAIILFIPLILFSLYILPRIVKFVAQTKELLFLFSFGWAFLISALFYYFDFSVVIGALVAGISLSVSPFKDEISYRIRPVRDFFVILFFVWLGSQMVITNFSSLIVPVVLLSLFVLIIEPIIVIALLGYLGFTRRTSFMAGLTMAQVSEFSLILIALAVKANHISEEVFSIIALTALITIAVSSYLMMYAGWLYPKVSRFLKIFERHKVEREKVQLKKKQAEIIMFGYNRIGHSLISAFEDISQDFMVIDHDPEAIEDAEQKGYLHCYGDAADLELLDDLDLGKTKLVVSTVPDYGINQQLVKFFGKNKPDILVVVVAHQIAEAQELYRQGADYVLMPHFLGGDYGAKILRVFGFKKDNYQSEKNRHIEELKARMEKGHEHPQSEG